MAIPVNVVANQTALAQSIAAGVAAYNARFAAQNQINLSVNQKGFSQPLGKITGDVRQFEAALAASNARVLAFGASTAVIGGVAKAMKELVSATVEIEKSLIDINRVLGLSTEKLSSFSKNLFDISRQTASAFKDTADAALEFSRQGLSTEQTLQRVSDAMLLVRLTGVSTKQAVEDLTAVTNSFIDVGLDTAQVLNKIVAVEQAFAVSASDLTSAVSRTGQAAKEAGVSFDQLNALVSAAQERTARGGAVIGNALKTIFTRLQRTETLDQLENFNIAVRDIEGNVLPAVQILQNLATAYTSLSDSTRSALSEQVAGVYQVNILKSILNDLNNEQSVYNRSLEIGTKATNEAQIANERLNTTIAALVSQTGTNLLQLGNNIGKVTFEPIFKSLISPFNDAIKYVNDLLEGEGMGSDFANGLLKGVRNILTGPAFVGAVAVIGKVILNTAKDISGALPALLGITTETQRRKNIEESILSILQGQSQISKALQGQQGNVAAQQQTLLQLAKQQTFEYQNQLNIAKQLAPLLASQNVTVGKAGLQVGKVKYAGHIPTYAAGNIPIESRRAEIIGAFQGGYAPGRIMPAPKSIGGIMNSAEEVKYIPGFAQPFINPPKNSKAGQAHRTNSIRKTGVDPYMHDGFIPNFGVAQFKDFIRSKGVEPDGRYVLGTLSWYKENPELVSEVEKYLAEYQKTTTIPGDKYYVPSMLKIYKEQQERKKVVEISSSDIGKEDVYKPIPENLTTNPRYNAATIAYRYINKEGVSEKIRDYGRKRFPELVKIIEDKLATKEEKQTAWQPLNREYGAIYEKYALKKLKEIGYSNVQTAESLGLYGSGYGQTAVDAVDMATKTFFEFKSGETKTKNINSKFERVRSDPGNFDILTGNVWKNVLVTNDYKHSLGFGNKMVHLNPERFDEPKMYLRDAGEGRDTTFGPQSLSKSIIDTITEEAIRTKKLYRPTQRQAPPPIEEEEYEEENYSGFIPNFAISKNAIEAMRRMAGYAGNDPTLVAQANVAREKLKTIGSAQTISSPNARARKFIQDNAGDANIIKLGGAQGWDAEYLYSVLVKKAQQQDYQNSSDYKFVKSKAPNIQDLINKFNSDGFIPNFASNIDKYFYDVKAQLNNDKDLISKYEKLKNLTSIDGEYYRGGSMSEINKIISSGTAVSKGIGNTRNVSGSYVSNDVALASRFALVAHRDKKSGGLMILDGKKMGNLLPADPGNFIATQGIKREAVKRIIDLRSFSNGFIPNFAKFKKEQLQSIFLRLESGNFDILSDLPGGLRGFFNPQTGQIAINKNRFPVDKTAADPIGEAKKRMAKLIAHEAFHALVSSSPKVGKKLSSANLGKLGNIPNDPKFAQLKTNYNILKTDKAYVDVSTHAEELIARGQSSLMQQLGIDIGSNNYAEILNTLEKSALMGLNVKKNVFANGFVPNFSLGSKHLNPDGKRAAKKALSKRMDFLEILEAFKMLNEQRRNNKIGVLKTDYDFYQGGKNPIIGLKRAAGINSREKQLKTLFVLAHELSHSNQLNETGRLRSVYTELFSKYYDHEEKGIPSRVRPTFDNQVSLLRERDAWIHGLKYIPSSLHKKYKEAANFYYSTYDKKGSIHPDFSGGFIPNFAYKNSVMALEKNLSGQTPILDTTSGPFPFIRNSSQPNFAAAVRDHGGLDNALSDSYRNQKAAGLMSNGFVPNFAPVQPQIDIRQSLGIKNINQKTADSWNKAVNDITNQILRGKKPLQDLNKEINAFVSSRKLLLGKEKELEKSIVEEIKISKQKIGMSIDVSKLVNTNKKTQADIENKMRKIAESVSKISDPKIAENQLRAQTGALVSKYKGLLGDLDKLLMQQIEGEIVPQTTIGKFRKLFSPSARDTRSFGERYRAMSGAKPGQEMQFSGINRSFANLSGNLAFNLGLPLVAGQIEQAIVGNKQRFQQTTGERFAAGAVSGIGTALGSGAALGTALAPILGPLAPFGPAIGAGTAAVIALTNAAIGAGDSLEDLQQKLEETTRVSQENVDATTSYVSQLESIGSITDPFERQQAAFKLEDTFQRISDVNLQEKFREASGDIDKMKNAILEFQKITLNKVGFEKLATNIKKFSEQAESTVFGFLSKSEAGVYKKAGYSAKTGEAEEGGAGILPVEIEDTKENLKNLFNRFDFFFKKIKETIPLQKEAENFIDEYVSELSGYTSESNLIEIAKKYNISEDLAAQLADLGDNVIDEAGAEGEFFKKNAKKILKEFYSGLLTSSEKAIKQGIDIKEAQENIRKVLFNYGLKINDSINQVSIEIEKLQFQKEFGKLNIQKTSDIVNQGMSAIGRNIAETLKAQFEFASTNLQVAQEKSLLDLEKLNFGRDFELENRKRIDENAKKLSQALQENLLPSQKGQIKDYLNTFRQTGQFDISRIEFQDQKKKEAIQLLKQELDAENQLIMQKQENAKKIFDAEQAYARLSIDLKQQIGEKEFELNEKRLKNTELEKRAIEEITFASKQLQIRGQAQIERMRIPAESPYFMLGKGEFAKEDAKRELERRAFDKQIQLETAQALADAQIADIQRQVMTDNTDAILQNTQAIEDLINFNLKNKNENIQKEIRSLEFELSSSPDRQNQIKIGSRIFGLRNELDTVLRAQEQTAQRKRLADEAREKASAISGVDINKYLGGQKLDSLAASDYVEALKKATKESEDQLLKLKEKQNIDKNNLQIQQLINDQIARVNNLKIAELTISEKITTQTEKQNQLEKDRQKRGKFMTGALSAIDQIQSQVDNFENTLGVTTVNAFRDGLVGAMDAAINKADDLESALMSVAEGFLRTIQQAMMQQVANQIVLGATSSFARQKGGVIKAQNGMYISGGRTGDKNPALLEDGEYVLNRQAVKALGGKSALDNLNFNMFPRFANGGINTGSAQASVQLTEPFAELSEFGRENSPEYQRYVEVLKEAEQKRLEKGAKRKALVAQLIGTAASTGLAMGLSRVNFGIGAGSKIGKPSSSQIKMLRNAGVSINQSGQPNMQKGGVMHFASGGYLPYGDRLNDTIPALLSGGEYIINSRATRKYGVSGLNKINSGIAKFEDGGFVGGEQSATSGSSAATPNNVNINITVNASGGSGADESKKSTGEDRDNTGAQLGDRIKGVVLKVITEEQRTGGLLDSTKKK